MIGYDEDSPDTEAPAASPDAEETPLTEEGSPEPDSDVVNVPIAALGGRNVQEGDTLTLKVIGSDDGTIRAVVEMGNEPEDEGDYQEAGPQFDQMAAANAA